MKNFFLTILMGLLFCQVSSAQQFALSTNAVDWADGLTLNLDASYAVGRHWSIEAGARYNPYTASSRQRAFDVGARFWPWYAYSGWWMSSHAKYQEYSRTLSKTYEGDRIGGSLSAGYSKMLGKHFNLDFGLGLWGGYEAFREYRCETCGQVLNGGERFFILPDDIIIAVTYVF